MSFNKIVLEALAKNPVGLKESLSEILSEKIAIALERKIEEVSESLDEAKTYNQGDEIIHKGSRVGNTRSIHKATFQKMHNGNAMVKNKEGILYAVNPRDIVKRLGEETDQLDEISGSTLGSYMVKANKDMRKNRDAASTVMTKFMRRDGTPTKKDIDDAQSEYMKYDKKANNRNRGLSNAESKLKGSSFVRIHATEEYSNNRLYENMNRATALKMDKEHGFYHDEDEDGLHHVFGASSGFSYSNHLSSADARKAADTMNKTIKEDMDQIDENWNKGASTSYHSDRIAAKKYKDESKEYFSKASRLGKDHPDYNSTMGKAHAADAKHIKHSYHAGNWGSMSDAKADHKRAMENSKYYKNL